VAEQSWTRADWARWFVHRDEVDEAARLLEPEDTVPLGRSDAANLTAALERHGLSGSYDDSQRALTVLRSSTRKPPARAPGLAPAATKKTA
jgi:hypothetical protein